MKVLITGSNGMLGHDLIDVLNDKHELILTTSKTLDITDKEHTVEFIKENKNIIMELAEQIFDISKTDIYAIGIGLFNKHVPEDEAGIFHIGSKYAVNLGKFYLISIADMDDYGLCLNNPIKLSSVSDEYFYMEHLGGKNGKIYDINRIGSCNSDKFNKPIDHWNVIIEYKHKFPILFNYELYTNAYEYDPITTEVKDIKNTPIFFCWIEE